MTYRIASIRTANGTRYYVQDQDGKRSQGGFATREKAERKIQRLKFYETENQREVSASSSF